MCRSLLPESSRDASYPVPVFEFLNVNELSMKRITFEGKCVNQALKILKIKTLEVVGEEGFEPPTNGV